MNVKIIKSKIPIIWIDTFVIIRFAKILKGENISPIEHERYTQLHEILKSKVQEKKLICVKSQQVDEIKLGRRLVDESNNVITRLSLGVLTKPPYGIEQAQLYSFMVAFYNSKEEVDIDYKQAFYRDPIKELNSNKQFIISFKENINEELIREDEERKEKIIVELEEIRQRCVAEGITYETQLEKENIGIIEAMLKYLENLKNGISKFDLNEFMAIIGDTLHLWSRISEINQDVEGLIKFYKSEYYQKMPYNNIRARLFAKIVTGINPIESGDSADVTNMSSVAPYCNMIITDKKMKNRIQNLGIDTEYDFKVFALKDYDEMIKYLQSI